MVVLLQVQNVAFYNGVGLTNNQHNTN